jgi:uncharacterized membrane protein
MITGTDATAQNIRAIADLERQAVEQRSRMQRVTQAITEAAGSPPFITVHAVWFVIWVALNRGPSAFDAYPFNLLNLLVSLEVIFLTSAVLMTQNRMTKQADRRAHLNLQVNLLAEQELTAILQMLQGLCHKAGTTVSGSDAHIEQLSKETDVVQLAVTLEKELSPPHDGNSVEPGDSRE